MAALIEIIMRGRDELSGPVGKAQISLGGMVKAGVAAAVGFGGMEAAMMGAKNVIVKSIGAAAAYEAQLAQIRALTGATTEDTDFLKGAISEMQETLPKSSAELGAGAYFILSSGITDAADAADVLEIAAKASTVGLGDTAVVADALTTVLNAYQMEAGQAGRVTDVLMQAVKDGKAEADAFSGVLGRVVPIASQMGISFEEVAANMATFTRLGVSAEEAATGLRGVMTQLLKPSEEAKELLAGVGMSMQEVRDQVREKGLLSVLDMLMTKFAGNEEAISTLFPDVRGLTNVLATAGVQGDAYAEILGNMDTATGNLDKGFEEVSDTTQFKMQKAMNDLNVQLEELGAEALPLVASAADTASRAIAAFSAVAKASHGDFSGFDDDVGELADDLVNLGLKMTMLGGPIRTGKDAIKELASGDVRGAVEQLDDEFGLLGEGVKGAADELKALAGGGRSWLEQASTMRGELTQTSSGMEQMTRRSEEAGQAWKESIRPAAELTGGIGDMGEELGKTSELFKDLKDITQDLTSELLPTEDEFASLAKTTAANRDAAAEWGDRIGKLQRDLADLRGELAAATKPSDVERLTERIADLQERIAETRQEAAESIPSIVDGFETWRTRVASLAEDYSAMEGNLQVIMDALVEQHVRGVDDIMAVVRTQGPEFAADFAQWFRDDPVAAATTLKKVMPGIMREAAETAIANVLAATSKFNEEWQKNVIDALNALPEEKKIRIQAEVDPELWLASAMVERMQSGEIPFDMQVILGTIPRHQGGGTVRSALQLVGERGPELVAQPIGSHVFTAAETRAMLSGASGGSAGGGTAIDEALLARMIGDAVGKQIAGLTITLDGREVGRVLSPRFAGAASLIGRGG